MKKYLQVTEVIDWQNSDILQFPEVVRALQAYATWDEMLLNLPDVDRNYRISRVQNPAL